MVAVVGRPNVGKSSLVNRFIGRRAAIVEETPGVTRDRHAFAAEWRGSRFEVVDTGGLEAGARGLDQRVGEQAMAALEAADLILFVVDVQSGVTADDLAVAARLRGSPKPVLLVVNKVDRPDVGATAEFYRLGLGEPLAVSALHGTGSGDLLDALVAALPTEERNDRGIWGSLALVGRPNVGKSSLLNRLLGETRAIVDPLPGTTRDPVDSYLRLPDGRGLRLVDTAGMRREVQVRDPIEYFSLLRSRGTLGRIDAAVLVVDADEGVTSHDQHIANEIVEAGRACLIVLNKWDLVRFEGPDRERFDRDLRTALRFLPWAPTLRASAVTGRGVTRILPAATRAIEGHRTRLTTSALNRVLRDAQAEQPHARSRGRAVRILYAVQARVAPPQVVLFSNARLDAGYLRYLERRIRAVEPFEGTPLRLEVRVRSRPKARL